jgi:CHAT domain-containing protein
MLNGLAMVYLSLCVGSLGATVTGEASFGIARAILDRGANCVVASSLPVADKMSREIAYAFYRNVRDGAGVDTALRKAQLSSLESGAPWFGWAGFQVLI